MSLWNKVLQAGVFSKLNQLMDDKNLKKIFDEFDFNNNGSIDQTEIGRVMEKLGI